MSTYGQWTEVREYRVWQHEDIYAAVTVDKYRNGWFNVSEDGSEDVYKTRSESDAFRYALSRMHVLETEACNACWCQTMGTDELEECADATQNVYGSTHGVRSYVYDSVNGTEIESYNL